MTTVPAKVVYAALADAVQARQSRMSAGPLRDALRRQEAAFQELAEERLGRARHADLTATGCDAASAWWLVQIARTSTGRGELVEHLRSTGHPRADEVAALGLKDFEAIARVVCGVAE